MDRTLLEQDMQMFHFGEMVTTNEVKIAYETITKVVRNDKDKQQIDLSLYLIRAYEACRKPLNVKHIEKDLYIFENIYENIPLNERNIVAKVCKWLGAERRRTVYISFASSDEKHPHIDDIEQRLERLFKILNIPYEVYTNTKETKISNFEKNIGKGNIVIIILSDKYFRSSHCMNEWTLIHSDIRDKKIVYVKCDDETIILNKKTILRQGFNFEHPKYRKSINDHWKKQRKDYEKIDRNVNTPSEVQQSDSRHNFYLEEFIEMNNTLRDQAYHKTSKVCCEFDIFEEIKAYTLNT